MRRRASFFIIFYEQAGKSQGEGSSRRRGKPEKDMERKREKVRETESQRDSRAETEEKDQQSYYVVTTAKFPKKTLENIKRPSLI